MFRIICLAIGIFIGGKWVENGASRTANRQSMWTTQNVREGSHMESSINEVVKRLRALGVSVDTEGKRVEVLKGYVIPVTKDEWDKWRLEERKTTSAAIPLISQLVDVYDLSFAGCESLDDQKLSQIHLNEFVHLQSLCLNGTSIGDDSLEIIGKLSQLVELSLTNTWITEKGLGKLRGLNHLRQLDLRGTQIGDEGMENLAIFMHQQLQSITLGGTQITSKGALHLARLSHLTSLDFSESNIDDRIMPMCAEFKQLKSLILNGTRITDTGLQVLASGQAAEQLHHLALSDTKITDKSVDTLRRFKHLKFLSVSDTSMTSHDIATIREGIPGLLISADRLVKRPPVLRQNN